LLLFCLLFCFAEGGSSGSGGEGGGKMPEMNVSANLMLATTLMGAVFVYQVGCHVPCFQVQMTVITCGS
jgi:hypothetical protein